MIDNWFLHQIDGWRRDLWAQQALFGDYLATKIDTARRAVRRDQRTVVYCVYENPFGRAGGIFQVAANLPRHLTAVSEQAIVLSPYHAALRTASTAAQRPVAMINVPYGGQQVPTEIREYRRDGVRWLLFEAEGFFDAYGGAMRDNPYDHGGRPTDEADSNALLLRDGLFASAAIPFLLSALGYRRDLVVHIQDWQLAPAALTVKQALLDGRLDSAAVLVTMHNPYDAYLPQNSLAAITDLTGVERWPSLRRPRTRDEDVPEPPRMNPRDTVYECMLPLTDAPVSTVSRGYAHELTTRPLHCVHFASHLQEIFRRQRLVGVDNGLFIAPRRAFTEQAAREAQAGDAAAILQEKLQLRKRMLEILTRYRPPQAMGWLSAEGSWDLTRLPDRTPVFMMFGRMDPAQKGFDLLLQAIRRLPPNAAKFVISPIVPEGLQAFRDNLRDLALTRPGEVVVFPFAMRDGYMETMAGASYCVMPSFHEPFGAATEPFLKGTPVVAHATGGLRQQVVDFDGPSGCGTGLLFQACRTGSDQQTGQEWSGILSTPHPRDRVRFPIYVSLVNGLAAAMSRAIEIYAQQPGEYGRMLANLHDQALRFSWERAAREYGQLYDLACGD